MDLGIAGRVALVTAASRGLGRASASALAREGAKVAICARDAEGLAEAEAELARHTEVLAVAADLSDPATPRMLVARTVERFGRLDILVANTGGPPPVRPLDVDDSALRAAVDLVLGPPLRLVREVIPHMRSGGWGRVCLVTSSTIKQPQPALALSGTARTGLWAWARTVATEVFADGITVNTVCPGPHVTGRLDDLPLPPGTAVGDPADFGEVVAFLCSRPARFVTGAAVVVDGGRYSGLS